MPSTRRGHLRATAEQLAVVALGKTASLPPTPTLQLAYANNVQPADAVPGAGTTAIVAVAHTTVSGTGRFRASVFAILKNKSETGNVSIVVETQFNVTGDNFTYANNTPVQRNVQISSAAGGITFGGGSGPATQASSLQSVPLTQFTFSWSGVVAATAGNAGGDAPFAKGSGVALLFKLTPTNNDDIQIVNLGISLEEIEE